MCVTGLKLAHERASVKSLDPRSQLVWSTVLVLAPHLTTTALGIVVIPSAVVVRTAGQTMSE